MKANRKFFTFSLLLNVVLAAAGFGILMAVRALSATNPIALASAGALLLASAVTINLFIVRRSKLKTPYFLFGTSINALLCAGSALAVILLAP